MRRTHGGAIQVKPMLYEPFRRLSSFAAQTQVQAAEKRRIGLRCRDDQSGEIIAFSAGTTTTQVGRSIYGRKGVTIVTNAINIAMELSHRLDLKIIMTGGSLNKNCFALSGYSGIDSINEMFYDRAFISVDGIHSEYGLTSDSPELGAVNRAMIQQSRKTVVVADHSKFGKVCKMLIAREGGGVRGAEERVLRLNDVPPVVPNAKPVIVERIKIHGVTLEGNLENNAVDRDVFVFLPPSYSKEKRRRYPVVYALHGYSIGAEQWAKEIHVPQTIEGAFALGAKEMIVVVPDSETLITVRCIQVRQRSATSKTSSPEMLLLTSISTIAQFQIE